MEDWREKWQENTRGGYEIVALLTRRNGTIAYVVINDVYHRNLEVCEATADGTYATRPNCNALDLVPVRRDPPLVAAVREFLDGVSELGTEDGPFVRVSGVGALREALAAHDAEAK
jgi:hypothetical protein